MDSEASSGSMFPSNVTGAFPVLVRGEGCYVWDEDGNRYLDGIAGIAVVNVGYGRAEIAQAMAEQARTLPYCAPNLFRNRPAMELVSNLRDFTPRGLNHFNFVSGGSEAVEVAMKLARQYHVVRGNDTKYKVLSRWTSYHGATLGALCVTGHFGRTQKFKPLLHEFGRIPASYCFRCSYAEEYPMCDLRCARALEEAILGAGPETVSAFIVEPIIGSTAGAVVAPDDYLPTIRCICDKYEVLLIADEVMTGFGRTGANFACDHWEVVPDIMTVAKAISSGYAPLGAAIASDAIAEAFAEAGSAFDHVFTYQANPVALVAGAKALDILQREKLVERSRERGAYLFEQAERLKKQRMVSDVRGKGLMMGIEFVQDQQSMEPFPPDKTVYKRVVSTALRNGLIVYPGQGSIDGRRGDHISIFPSLTISEAEIDEMVDILDRTFSEVEAQLSA